MNNDLPWITQEGKEYQQGDIVRISHYETPDHYWYGLVMHDGITDSTGMKYDSTDVILIEPLPSPPIP